jgi:hypothetical protein
MVTWFNAKDIIKKFEDNSIDYFYNFVLGKAYTAQDMRIDRDTINQNTTGKTSSLKNVVMGSDIGKPHWYWLATPAGYFRYGKTESWDELEYLFNFYKCDAWVIDAMPEITMVQKMIKKYNGKVWGCYFSRDTKNIGAIRWGEGDKRGIVNADRTKVIDRYVNEIANKSMPFNLKLSDMEEYILHAANMYRTVETDDKGGIRVDWKTGEGKPDHLVFAGVYCRMALEHVFSGVNSGVVETAPLQNANTAPTIRDGNITVDLDIEKSMERARNAKR